MSTPVAVWKDVNFTPVLNQTPLCWHWRKSGKCEISPCRFSHSTKPKRKLKEALFSYLVVTQKPTQKTDGRDYNQTKLLEDILEQSGGTSVSSSPDFFWMTSTKFPTKNIIPGVTFVNRFCLAKSSAARITQKASLIKTLHNTNNIICTPESYLFPDDVKVFYNKYLKEESTDSSVESGWICKPARGGGGTGITLIIESLREELLKIRTTPTIVSRYISNPLLINDHKVDVRFYCLLTSVAPDCNFDLWSHEEALVRHAVNKYDSRSTNPSSYLTFIGGVSETDHRYARRNNSSWKDLLDTIPSESARNLSSNINKLFNYLFESGYCDVVRSLSLQTDRQFELFGVDVLIDDNLRPWILEVNSNPDLTATTPAGGRVFKTEEHVKSIVVSDMLNLINSLGTIPGGWQRVK